MPLTKSLHLSDLSFSLEKAQGGLNEVGDCSVSHTTWHYWGHRLSFLATSIRTDPGCYGELLIMHLFVTKISAHLMMYYEICPDRFWSIETGWLAQLRGSALGPAVVHWSVSFAPWLPSCLGHSSHCQEPRAKKEFGKITEWHSPSLECNRENSEAGARGSWVILSTRQLFGLSAFLPT